MFNFFKRKKTQPEPPPTPVKTPEPSKEKEEAGDPRDFILQIPGEADRHVEMSKEIFGATLDFSQESLALIDKIVSENWSEPPVFLDAVVIPFGSYVGETFRRQLGGTWVYDEQFGYMLTEVGGTDTKIFPFGKVRKRFVNGEEDSIAFFYRAVTQMIADQRAS